MAERLTDEQIDELERLDREATAGPWLWGDGDSCVLGTEGIISQCRNVFVNCGRGSGDPRAADRDLIINGRNALPALLREIRERRAAERAEERDDDGWCATNADGGHPDDPTESEMAAELERAGWRFVVHSDGRGGSCYWQKGSWVESTADAYRRMKGL